MKYLSILIVLVCFMLPSLALPPNLAARWECVRWTWHGDVYNRTVICLEWRDKDAKKLRKNYD